MPGNSVCEHNITDPFYARRLRYDAWMASILGKSAFNLSIDEALVGKGREARGRFGKLFGDRPVFVYAKIVARRTRAAAFAESLGFRLVEASLSFDKPVSAVRSAGRKFKIRQAAGEDREAVKRVARCSFALSRFHLDPDIPNEKANRFKAEWAGNYFSGRRGDRLLVAEKNKKVAGFLLLMKESPKRVMIDLIAVDPKYRGQGAGAELVACAESFCRGYSVMSAVTQGSNAAAVRCFEKCGFRFTGCSYVFHYHSGAGRP